VEHHAVVCDPRYKGTGHPLGLSSSGKRASSRTTRQEEAPQKEADYRIREIESDDDEDSSTVEEKK
jgi:hypothetical protein